MGDILLFLASSLKACVVLPKVLIQCLINLSFLLLQQPLQSPQLGPPPFSTPCLPTPKTLSQLLHHLFQMQHFHGSSLSKAKYKE